MFLHGPHGTGNTSLARLCTGDASVNLFSINGAEIVSQYYGESEQALHDIFFIQLAKLYPLWCSLMSWMPSSLYAKMEA